MLKIGLSFGSLFALLSIILGAFGAHALKDQLSEYSRSIYDKAVLYQMFHALGILVVTIIGENIESINVSVPIICFIVGIVFFSGSLYILAITDIKWFGMITPIGGIFFIVGWVIMLFKTLSL